MPRAVIYAIGIWLVGFVWGAIVMMTPALAAVPAIAGVSAHPAISLPLLLLFPWLAFIAARRCMNAGVPALTAGAVFAAVNLALDALVIAGAFGNGVAFFLAISVWLAYALLIVGAWRAGRS